MMYRYRKCRDNLWYIQEKHGPGLAGGIWRRIGQGFPTEREAHGYF